MKAIEERDELLTTRRMHRELQSGFDCFSTAVCEVCASRRFDWHDRVQLLGELRHLAVVIVSAAHVNQFLRLLLDRFDDLRMAVPRRTDRDARVAVEKNIPVNIFDPNSTGALGDEFKERAGIRGVNKPGIRFDDLLAVGTRQLRLDLRTPEWCDYAFRHFFLP